MVANFSVIAGGVEIAIFLALGGTSKFDTVIPKTPDYEGMVVWILNNLLMILKGMTLLHVLRKSP